MTSSITEVDINSLLGRLSYDSLLDLTKCILSSSGNEAIKVLEKIYDDGNEPIQILTNLMMFLKNLLIIKTCDAKSALELTNLTDDQIKTLSGLISGAQKK